MLFPSEALIKARRRLVGAITNGNAEAERRAYDELLVADKHDSICLVGMGKLLSAAGDKDGAISCLRRAVDSQPCLWHPFLELALKEAIYGQGNRVVGLTELAFRKLLMDPDSLDGFLRDYPHMMGKSDDGGPGVFQGDDGLEGVERLEAIIGMLRDQRDLEPLEVTAHLRPLPPDPSASGGR